MAAKVKDRVVETTLTTGTGTLTLAGAKAGYRTFASAFTSGDTVYYYITDSTDWEVGSGVYTTAGATLTRATIAASSNGGAAVNWAAGSKDVVCNMPAAELQKLIDNSFGPTTITGGTLVTDVKVLDLSATWNAAGVTFTGIKANATDTASNAASLLLDLQLGAASNFTIGKNLMEKKNGTNAQTFNLYNTYTDASNYERVSFKWDTNIFTIDTRNGAAGTGTARSSAILLPNNGNFAINGGAGGGTICNFNQNYSLISQVMQISTAAWIGAGKEIGIINGAGIVWSTTSTPAGTPDLGLQDTAAGVLTVTNGSTGGATLEFREQTAPSAAASNSVRIYAVDNGAGKTQLMALFATGAAQQIAIEP